MSQSLTRRLEYDDLPETSDDGRRFEIIDGVLHVTPSPAPRHQWASKKLQRQLEAYFEDRQIGTVWNAPLDLILGRHDVLIPDLIVLTDRRHLSARGVEGPPAIVVEILSPSSVATDRTTKSRRYAELGVPHFWILDATHHTLECFRLDEGRYTLVATGRDDDRVTHPDWAGLTLSLADLWLSD